MTRYKDMTGERFGRLTVLQRAGWWHGRTYWKLRCDCGNEIVTSRSCLVKGTTNSCGCIRSERGRARAKDEHGRYK